MQREVQSPAPVGCVREISASDGRFVCALTCASKIVSLNIMSVKGKRTKRLHSLATMVTTKTDQRKGYARTLMYADHQAKEAVWHPRIARDRSRMPLFSGDAVVSIASNKPIKKAMGIKVKFGGSRSKKKSKATLTWG